MGRAPCCDKVGLKKGRWTVEEDDTLTKYIQAHGEGSWRSLPKNAGLLRCGKSCRLRWINYLKSDLKRGNISSQEDDIIIKLHASLGNKWSVIASQLAGRTDNEIKNYWNSHLSRKIDTFRRPHSEPLPLPILVNLGAINTAALKRKGGGRTSRAAMKKNKSSKTGDTKPDQSVQENGNHGMPSSYQEEKREGITLGFGEEKEEGTLMVSCPTSDIDHDIETSDQLMVPLHEEGGLMSFHDINEEENNNNNNNNVDFLENIELCESLEIGGGTLSSNSENLWSDDMEDVNFDWEEFVNENLWANDQEKDDEETLSWSWDKDNNIINFSEDQGDNAIQGMESGKKDTLLAWLFS